MPSLPFLIDIVLYIQKNAGNLEEFKKIHRSSEESVRIFGIYRNTVFQDSALSLLDSDFPKTNAKLVDIPLLHEAIFIDDSNIPTYAVK